MSLGRRFPHLVYGRATVPFELGLATLLVWVGLVLRDSATVGGRYPRGYWIWQWVESTGLDDLAPWLCLAAAAMTVCGLFLEYFLGAHYWKLKAIGLMIATMVFGFVAVGHLSVTGLSVAGPAYLFIAWRCLVLSSLYWHRGMWTNALEES